MFENSKVFVIVTILNILFVLLDLKYWKNSKDTKGRYIALISSVVLAIVFSILLALYINQTVWRR